MSQVVDARALMGWRTWWASTVLALMLLQFSERAWRELFPLLWHNRNAALLAIGALAVAALALFRMRLNAQGHWLCALMAALLLTLPPWAALLTSLLAFGAAARRRTAWFVIPLIFLMGFAVATTKLYGFNGDTLLAVLQTHTSEAADFVFDNLGGRFVLGFATQLILLRLCYEDRQAPLPGGRASVALLAFALMAGAAATLIGPARDAAKYVRDLPRLAQPPRSALVPRDVDVLLILGEATSKWHLQLYGYPYATMPKLSSRAGELVLLTDAVSLHSHTVQSISSLMLRRSPRRSDETFSLMGRLRAAGVKTSWYSSQSGQGAWDSPVRQIGRDAQSHRFFQGRSKTFPLGLDYRLGLGKGFTADVDMMKQLTSDLVAEASGPSFRVAHLTTGHDDYCRNLPHEARAAFEKTPRGTRYFGDAPDRTTDVNCYDSGMLLLDSLIEGVIKQASRRQRPTVIVFAPDHGEDPDGGTGHASALYMARHVEIPVLAYFNPAAKTVLADQLQALIANAGRPFALPWLHESLLDAFGLLNDDEFASRSLLSTRYLPGPRMMFADSLPIPYDAVAVGGRQDYLHVARLAMEQVREQTGARRAQHILGHRNNSELALMEAMQIFEGAEMDVVFDHASSRFQIYHGPAASTGYTLERALEIASVKPDFLFWFDWKNASKENLSDALGELERLDAKFHFRSRAWVETGPDFVEPEGRLLANGGFRHSFYLPPDRIADQACRADPTGEVCVTAASRLAQLARQVGADRISFDLAHEALGRAVVAQDPGLLPLTWDLSVDASQPGLVQRLEKGAFAEVELIRLPSRYWR